MSPPRGSMLKPLHAETVAHVLKSTSPVGLKKSFLMVRQILKNILFMLSSV